MKKNSFIYAGAVVLFDLFLSCSFESAVVKNQPADVTFDNVDIHEVEFFNPETLQLVSFNRNDEIYAIKYNKSANGVIPEGKSGYVKNVKKRTVEDSFEDFDDGFMELPEDESFDVLKDKFYSESKISAMRDDFFALQEKNRGIDRSVDRALFPELDNLEIQKENYAIGDTRKMNAQIGAGDNVTTETVATLMAIGEKCYVWYIDNNPEVKIEDFNDDDIDNMCSFQTLADKFDSIVELEESILGSHTYSSKCWAGYINSFEKISIVVVDIDGDAPVTEGSYILGYFHPVDFYLVDYPSYSSHTNRGEIIYVDSHSYQRDAKSIYSTLVHEYNHLLNYVQKVVVNDTSWTSWFTEMMAMVCEDLFQDYLGLSDEAVSKNRLSLFNQNYNQGFLNWDTDDLDIRVKYSYPNTYAFGAYLVRNFGGLELLHELATNKGFGIESINLAFEKLGIKKYGSDEIADFNYALKQEPFILINTNKDSDYSNTISLNKGIGTAEEPLHFTPIVLKDFTLHYGSQEYTTSPYIFTAKSKGCVELGKSGFSINYIGKNIQSMDVYSPAPEYINSIVWSVIEY